MSQRSGSKLQFTQDQRAVTRPIYFPVTSPLARSSRLAGALLIVSVSACQSSPPSDPATSNQDDDPSHSSTDEDEVSPSLTESDDDSSEDDTEDKDESTSENTDISPTDGDSDTDDQSSTDESSSDNDDSTSDDDSTEDPDETPDWESENQELLYHAVRFFGGQRCGDHNNWLLRDNKNGSHCHLEDGDALAAGTDLRGGWHDAGDYIKFTLNNAWAAYALLKAYDTFPSAFRDVYDPEYRMKPNGIPDVLDEVRFATDYLAKLMPSPGTMINRVGGNQDHNHWVTSPYQSMMSAADGGGARPVYAEGKADVAGLSAAALALMSTLYADHDAEAAELYLAKAIEMYEHGQANPDVTKDNFYQDVRWRDNMLCGATELYRATEDEKYLDDARSLDQEIGPHGSVMAWTNAHDLCRHTLSSLGETESQGFLTRDVDRYLGSISNSQYIEGLAFFGDSWGTLQYASAAAYSGGLLYDLTGDASYLEFTKSQVDYALGDNEYNHSFLVGWGPNPPKYPHHKNAYGRDDLEWKLDQLPLYELTGTLVGGPTTSGVGPNKTPGYVDDIHDYVRNEVSLGYSAMFIGALSAIVAHELESPPSR